MSGHALYAGTVRHVRLAPRRHEVRHEIVLPFVDVDRAEGRRGPLSRRWPGVVRLRRADFLPDREAETLRGAVEACVREAGAALVPGPIRLLANLRCFGHCFNPAAFFYCLTADERQIQAIVVEVTNTPWSERHAYVLHDRAQTPGSRVSGRMNKALHVSPFMSMDQIYRWRGTTPGERLRISFASEQAGRTVFHASLDLERRPLGRAGLTGATLRRPAPSARTLARIYRHAAALWAKRIGMVEHT